MKRLRNTVPSKNTTRKKNNGGMTYVELLVALSLLVLIVTMFSPMLLKSYDRIYRAGEITSNAFDSRQELEKGLASREDHTTLGFEAKFASNGGILADKIYIMAKRVVSSFEGLETLYVGGKGRIEIVADADDLVKDNQSSQVVRIKLTNLAYKDYDVIEDVSAVEQFNKGNVTQLRGKVLFYICSIFDTKTALDGEVIRKPNFKPGNSYFPYCDLRIDNIDITKSPLKIVAYYLNEYGSVKEATTYLNIEKPDVIFVGETSADAQYFTLSDAGSFDAAIPVIAGRKMNTAPIPPGKTLTDVTFVNAMGPVKEGYYSMCGEDGIIRRLWKAENSSKSEIKYKSETINGSVYYQYDWNGDYVDNLTLSDKAGRGNLSYGSGSTAQVDFGEDNYLRKDQFSITHVPRFAYYVNGFTSSNNSYKNDTKRISYVLGLSASEFSQIYNTTPIRDGYIVKKIRAGDYGILYDIHEQNGVTATASIYPDRIFYDQRYIFNYNNNTWYKFEYKRSELKSTESQNLTGMDLGVGLVDGRNAVKLSGIFRVRNNVVDDNAWASNENVSLGKPDSADQDRDRSIAYITLKAYSSMSPTDLVATSTVEAKNEPQKGIVDLTSCIGLPNGTGDTLYLGNVNTSALINETKGITASTDSHNGYTSDVGFGASHIYIGADDGVYTVNYDQYEDKKQYINGQSVFNNKGHYLNDTTNAKPVPSSRYGRDKLKGTINSYTSFAKDTDMRFTMGYSSDLFVVYSSLAGEDDKPLEGIYSASAGISDNNDLDGDFRKNLWFPREFLNITESADYNKSIVAVGYDIGGYSKIFYDTRVEYTSGVNKRFLEDDRDLDKDNNGVVDLFDLGPGEHVYNRIVDNHISFQEAWAQGLFYSPYGNEYYIIDAGPGMSCKDEKIIETALALPKHTTVSTVVDKIVNNGVIAVYNENDSTFTPIGYYKTPDKTNVRFTSVSVDMLSGSGQNGVLGAAIGGSNGKLYFAKLTYTDGAIVKTALRSGSTLIEIKDFSDTYSSIDAVKAFNLNGTFYILVGGKSANGTGTISLVTVNASAPASSTVTSVRFADTGFDITDIILADKYICFTSHQSDGEGSLGCIGIGNLFTNGEFNINATKWKYATEYYTQFTSDETTGEIKASGSGTPLPQLKALASSVPVNYTTS